LKESITQGFKRTPSGQASLPPPRSRCGPRQRDRHQPAFAYDAGMPATEDEFDIAAVNTEGASDRLEGKAEYGARTARLAVVMKRHLARMRTVWRAETAWNAAIDIPDDTPDPAVARAMDFGRYRIEVLEDGGLAATIYVAPQPDGCRQTPDVRPGGCIGRPQGI